MSERAWKSKFCILKMFTILIRVFSLFIFFEMFTALGEKLNRKSKIIFTLWLISCFPDPGNHIFIYYTYTYSIFNLMYKTEISLKKSLYCFYKVMFPPSTSPPISVSTIELLVRAIFRLNGIRRGFRDTFVKKKSYSYIKRLLKKIYYPRGRKLSSKGEKHKKYRKTWQR